MAYNIIEGGRLFRWQQSEGSRFDIVTPDRPDPEDGNETWHHDRYPCMLESDLVTLSVSERIIFTIIIVTLSFLSLCGNMGTIYVNLRRKIRPLFRVCIISLACADIINTIFLCLAYCGQFAAHYVQVWLLGPVLCKVVPFFTTSAILSTSMTLIGIALDRYYVLRHTAIACWRPSLTFGVISMTCIWLASFVLSTPVFFLYKYLRFHIVGRWEYPEYGSGFGSGSESEDSGDLGSGNSYEAEGGWAQVLPRAAANLFVADYNFIDSEEMETYGEHRLSAMCGAYQRDVAIYFVTVFGIIFVPCILASIFLNLVIAREIWQRRHKPKHRPKQQSNTVLSQQVSIKIQEHNGCSFIKVMTVKLESNKEELAWPKTQQDVNEAPPPYSMTSSPEYNAAHTPSSETSTAAIERRRRHLRMVTIIILLMSVFICLRLPAWVFLVMRMYGSYTAWKHWIIFFSFGILNLASSALNPLFYTFLAETLQCISYIKIKLCSTLCNCCSCVCLCLCRTRLPRQTSENNSQNS